MAFIYDEQNHQAIDRETGETVTGPHGFTDIGGVFSYKYNRPHEFPLSYAISFDTYRQEPILDISHPFDINAVEIYEADLRHAYYESRVFVVGGGPDVDGTEETIYDVLAGWDALKQRIAEGTLTRLTKNGDPKSWFPHYHVRWVELLPNG